MYKQEKDVQSAHGIVATPHPQEALSAYVIVNGHVLDLQGWIIYRLEQNEHQIDVYAGRPKKNPQASGLETFEKKREKRV